MTSFQSRNVAEVFASYPPRIRRKLLALRALILVTAGATDGIGEIEETLKWGEPAYLTKNKGGSTLRIAWKPATAQRFGIYFNCQTSLVETFRRQFPEDFIFEGNRAIVFDESDELPRAQLAICIAAALTYHRKKAAS
jgi:hypothetical protein